jgi:hypothetical protein
LSFVFFVLFCFVFNFAIVDQIADGRLGPRKSRMMSEFEDKVASGEITGEVLETVLPGDAAGDGDGDGAGDGAGDDAAGDGAAAPAKKKKRKGPLAWLKPAPGSAQDAGASSSGAGAAAASAPSESAGDRSMSVDATNALRAKLGLKPLK